MAQRSKKKLVKKADRKAPQSMAQKAMVSTPPDLPGSRPGGSSFGKWLIIAVLLVLAWELGNSFFGSYQGKKYFTVKRVSQFTGTDSTGSPMSAYGIMAVGPHELAVADAKGCRVLIFDFNGKLLRSWGKRGDKGPYEFNEPSDVAIDPKGHLYVLDSWNGAIKIFNMQGKYSGVVDLHKAGGFFGPRRMVWEGDDFLIPSSDAVNRLSISEQLILDSIGGKGSGKGQFLGISGLALDGEGDIYVGDRGNKRVQEFDKSGKVIQVIDAKVSPFSIALDSRGHVFVGSDSGPSKVFDTSGKFLGILAEISQPDVRIPMGSMCVSPDGLLIIGADDLVTVYQVLEQEKK